MNRSLRSFSVRLVFGGLALTSLLVTARLAPAQQAPTIAYQGYVTDTAGTPLDGTVNLDFHLYATAAGGTALWAEKQTGVVVQGGVFEVRLGRVSSLGGVDFGQAMWLGVQVNGGTELVPRMALAAAPHALSVRGFRTVPGEDDGDVPSVIAGDAGNAVVEDVTGATIGGGGGQKAGSFATVGGGRDNEALDCYDTVGGGLDNRAESLSSNGKAGGAGCYATVAGGRGNEALNEGASVGGGIGNTASGIDATVAGGTDNTASRSSATVGGGLRNTASGSRATVPGGQDNQARGEHSLAAGTNARAAHDGAFVWADFAGTDSLVSTAPNQFLVRASGGVGVGTTAPQGALHVIDDQGRADLVLGGTDDSVFGDDGTLASNPNLPSSDLWLISNDAVAVMLNADDSAEQSDFLIVDEDLDVLFGVDGFGVARANHLEAQSDLKPGSAPAEGGVYRDNVVYAWAHVQGDGSVVASFGCTVTRTATGTYRIQYQQDLDNGASPLASPLSANDPVIATIASSVPSQATVKMHAFIGGQFVAQDRAFFFQVVGRP